MEERLQKILARSGFGSRRACEELIINKRVSVNGKSAELGMKVNPTNDKIVVDGSALHFREPEKVYIKLYKPRFALSVKEPSDPRLSVYQLVPDSDNLFVVGRLDFESEGLIMLTNDGALANKLAHPRYGKEKEYHVLLAKRPDEKQLKVWQRGVVLEDGEKTAPASVQVINVSGKGAWVRVVMAEGRKRQIREIGKAIGLPIVRLIRMRIGNLELGNLKPREWVYLSVHEVDELRRVVNAKKEPQKNAQPTGRSSTSLARAKRVDEKPYRSASRPPVSNTKTQRKSGSR